MTDFIKSNFGDMALIVRYGISGVSAILANLATIYVATHFFGFFYLWSAFLAFLASLIVGFVLQKFWTFRSMESGKLHTQLANYFLVAVLGSLLGIFLLYVFTSVFGIWYLFSQVIALGIVAVLSFIVNKNHTFHSPENIV